jgi:hypothetical protein
MVRLLLPLADEASSVGHIADIEWSRLLPIPENQQACHNEDMNTRSKHSLERMLAARPLSGVPRLFERPSCGASSGDDSLGIRFPCLPHRPRIPTPVRNNRRGISDIQHYRS